MLKSISMKSISALSNMFPTVTSWMRKIAILTGMINCERMGASYLLPVLRWPADRQRPLFLHQRLSRYKERLTIKS